MADAVAGVVERVVRGVVAGLHAESVEVGLDLCSRDTEERAGDAQAARSAGWYGPRSVGAHPGSAEGSGAACEAEQNRLGLIVKSVACDADCRAGTDAAGREPAVAGLAGGCLGRVGETSSRVSGEDADSEAFSNAADGLDVTGRLGRGAEAVVEVGRGDALRAEGAGNGNQCRGGVSAARGRDDHGTGDLEGRERGSDPALERGGTAVRWER